MGRAMLAGKHIQALVLAFCIVPAMLLAAPASGYPGLEEARQTAYEMADQFIKQGWNVRNEFQRGHLGKGESTTITATLYQGNAYAFIASGGPREVFDVDLLLFDENNNLVDQDRENENVAVVTVTPRWTGTFHIKIVMEDSAAEGAHYCLVTGYR